MTRTKEEAELRSSASGMVAHRRSFAATGRCLTDTSGTCFGERETVHDKVEQLPTASAGHVTSITFTVNSVASTLRQVHIFAE
jgi:hypothetical protein